MLVRFLFIMIWVALRLLGLGPNWNFVVPENNARGFRVRAVLIKLLKVFDVVVRVDVLILLEELGEGLLSFIDIKGLEVFKGLVSGTRLLFGAFSVQLQAERLLKQRFLGEVVIDEAVILRLTLHDSDLVFEGLGEGGVGFEGLREEGGGVAL